MANKTNHPKKYELPYLAGMFDGEGYIGLGPHSADGKQWSMMCRIGMMGDYIPHLFLFNFGGNLGHQKNGLTYWQISSHQALLFLKAMLPYLRLKLPQAELALRFQERLEKTKPFRIGKRLSKEETILRQAERILMQELKRQTYRGVNAERK